MMDSLDYLENEEYPPDLSEERLFSLVSQIKDWQINHGSLLKRVQSETENSVLSHPVGCFPSTFPRDRFQQALEVQQIFNKLYCSIAEDEDWIYNAIQDLIPVEPLAKALWGIHEAARDAGYVQDISAGIFRSDYMLHLGDSSREQTSNVSKTSLKQVEFNSFSCSGFSHANKVANMHRYLARTGSYNVNDKHFPVDSLPKNHNIESIAAILASAHHKYGPPRSKLVRQTAILFIVQPFNFNIADERPIEYVLWNQDDAVPNYRIDFPDILKYTKLTEERALLFHPPWLASENPVEISVIYQRAGYEAREYDESGFNARLQLEKSTAIKCPSVLGHLTTFKKVQQALTEPRVLERFLSSSEVARIRETFVPILPLDDSTAGLEARQIACDVERSTNYILKPSLEGGGNNVYGNAIPAFLNSIATSEWSRYILMEKIHPPDADNLLMGPACLDGERRSQS
ncbi:hypothetical protein N7450_002025 [Penicillium hetheringtonii]|uniref:Glutathione synthetase n=1 Tax=Penicillium hetheringtonii TaxID=911720 RepID=A0AAD6E6H7_9EURO|nr:hypothetical protein N7450_002025 [Penicillium hetheringtonii]